MNRKKTDGKVKVGEGSALKDCQGASERSKSSEDVAAGHRAESGGRSLSDREDN